MTNNIDVENLIVKPLLDDINLIINENYLFF